MRSARVLQNAEEFVRSHDFRLKRTGMATLAAHGRLQHRELFEEFILDPDPATSLLAFQALKKILPAAPNLNPAWKELFGESVDLLVRRASNGPLQLRVAALQALSFAPTGMTAGAVEFVLQSIQGESLDGSLSEHPPLMPLVNTNRSLDLPEGFALVLSALPSCSLRASLLRRELSRGEPERVLPVLLSLQMAPIPEFTDLLVGLLRSPEPDLSIEAARALLVCGGNRVHLVLSSILHETVDPNKKAHLLSILGQTGKEEFLPLLMSHLSHSSPVVRKAAVSTFGMFPLPPEEKLKLLNDLLNDPNPEISTNAAQFLWKMGSLEALPRLEAMLKSGKSNERTFAAEAIGKLPFKVSIPILIDSLGKERHGDTRREILISLRRLLPKAGNTFPLLDQLLLYLKKHLDSSEPFLRSQVAVLCGMLGSPAEDLLLAGLEKEENPHVLSSLLASLGRIGNPRLLVVARFRDHPDSRVRANLMDALAPGGMSAIPYLTGGLKDPSPRVRSSAARNLFFLGDMDVVATLNRMLLVPSPLPVLSACHALGQLMRISPAALKAEHPISLSLSRISRKIQKGVSNLPPLLRETELIEVFDELSKIGADLEGMEKILTRYFKSNPRLHGVRRMLSSVCAGMNNPMRGLPLLEMGLKEHPNILADQFDMYRLSLAIGNYEKANLFKEIVKRNYGNLHEACRKLCIDLRGKGADEILEKLLHLDSPSMNLYNAMIQLKALQGEMDVVLDLLSELLLARPTNGIIAQKIVHLLPDGCDLLKEALNNYAQKLLHPVL